MRFLTSTSLIAALIFCNASFAELSLGPKPNKAGNIGLVIVASHTPEYIKQWLMTPSHHAVTIKRLKSTKPNQLIVSAFLVTGTTPNSEGNYNFSVSFKLIDPNKKIMFSERDYAKGKSKQPSNPTYIMADPALDIILEPSDPEGVYTIMAQVTDLVSGKKANNEYKINFIKSKL